MATAILPTSVPSGNASGIVRLGPLVQLSVTGSYTCKALVVSGTRTLRFPTKGYTAVPQEGIATTEYPQLAPDYR